MNRLYVGADGTVTLTSATRTASGQLSGLKTLAAQAKAKGATLLIMDGELQDVNVPDGVPPTDLTSYLDAQHRSLVVAPRPPSRPRFVSLHDAAAVQAARTAAKSAGMTVKAIMPLLTAACTAAATGGSAIVVHVTPDVYDVTILGQRQVTSRRQARLGQEHAARTGGLGRIVDAAASRLISGGETPTLILVQDEATTDLGTELSTGLRVVRFSTEELLTKLARTGQIADLTDDQGNQMTLDALRMERQLVQRRPLDRQLLTALGVAAALNGGLYLAANVVSQHVDQLQQQKAKLQPQDDAVLALRTANTQLEGRNAQAKALILAKGPLAADLPLIALRVAQSGGALQSLAGPNTVAPTETRGFGASVSRSYDLAASTADPQAFTGEFQQRGLASDVHDIDCSKAPCSVSFRTAPVSTPVSVLKTATSTSTPEAHP